MQADVSPRAGERPPRLWYLGLGLWWTWFTSFVVSDPVLLPILQQSPALISGMRIALFSASAAGLIVVAANRTAIAPLRERRALISLSLCLMSVGTLLVGLAGRGIVPGAWLLGGAAIAGFSSVPLMMAWCELLGAVGTRTASITVAGSMLLVAVAISAMAMASNSLPWITVGILVLLPIASLVMFTAAGRIVWRALPLSGRLDRERFPIPSRIVAGLVIYGVAVGLMLGLGASTAGSRTTHIVFGIGIGLAALLLLLRILLSSREVDYSLAYRLVLPLVAGGLLLTTVLDQRHSVVGNAVVSIGWACQVMFAMIISADLSSRLPAPALAVFSQKASALQAGIAAGVLLHYVSEGWAIAETPLVPLIALAVVFCMIFAGMFLLNEPSRATVWGLIVPPPPPAAAVSALEERSAVVARTFGLTSREQEILLLLARGRNAEHISTELFISVFTARTHIQRIYSKLDVHSQQDLIDIVEAAGPSE